MKVKTLVAAVSLFLYFNSVSISSFAGKVVKGKNDMCLCCEEVGFCEESSIDLVSFELSRGRGYVVMEWATNYEKNSDHFNIYGSTDGYNFEYIKRLDGQGNTDHSSQYKTIINTPKVGKYYYYIEQVDFDGTTESFVPEMIEVKSTH